MVNSPKLLENLGDFGMVSQSFRVLEISPKLVLSRLCRGFRVLENSPKFLDSFGDFSHVFSFSTLLWFLRVLEIGIGG